VLRGGARRAGRTGKSKKDCLGGVGDETIETKVGGRGAEFLTWAEIKDPL